MYLRHIFMVTTFFLGQQRTMLFLAYGESNDLTRSSYIDIIREENRKRLYHSHGVKILTFGLGSGKRMWIGCVHFWHGYFFSFYFPRKVRRNGRQVDQKTTT